MAERSKQWLLVGTGALFGSLSTVALLRLFSRWAGKRQVKGLLTSCSVISDWNGKEKLFGRCGTRYNGAPDGLVYSDLLKDEVVSEQLTRNIQFFGMESQQKVTESYVVVIGLGGVGSHAASMLLRSGVGRLLLVDFDQVSLSSLNRHAVATRDDVGTPKALCLQKHFSAIFPECHVEARVQLYDASSEEEILSGRPDFVLDCIDNIDTKVALLAACVRRGLRVLSAMGAGARADPTRIRVADLRESSIDPLSRSVRHRLRKDYGIEGGIAVVFSLEKPKVKLLPFKGLTGEEENPSDYQIVPGFRVRIIPVLGTIPAIFGQVMASYVATQLAGLCVQTEPVVNLDLDHYRILHQRLLEHEELIYGSAVQVLDMDTRQWRLSLCSAYWFILNHMGLLCYAWFGVIFTTDVEEVMYVVKELWHGRSARDQSQKDVGRKMWRSVNELMLVRWDKSRPATVNNLIPLKFTEAGAHESTMIDRIREEEPEFYTMVANVLKRAEEEFALR
ncbi:tRNA threonylcarbamoyladenosine dehydratase 2-like isoform X1 [Phoenix dactylifera]|uniref:tRNA threonylcarbamoyladenosine dehydratase 2-like isoform X1 n=1 Tax=Phoenix dactylifera TaxID=42345 RepID=A0A8B8ZU59_PHODC|nr:tRNA threonylcarbamoyladenosine dehydratase 2-like isoform X1 [Phoenix dactylifera]